MKRNFLTVVVLLGLLGEVLSLVGIPNIRMLLVGFALLYGISTLINSGIKLTKILHPYTFLVLLILPDFPRFIIGDLSFTDTYTFLMIFASVLIYLVSCSAVSTHDAGKLIELRKILAFVLPVFLVASLYFHIGPVLPQTFLVLVSLSLGCALKLGLIRRWTPVALSILFFLFTANRGLLVATLACCFVAYTFNPVVREEIYRTFQSRFLANLLVLVVTPIFAAGVFFSTAELGVTQGDNALTIFGVNINTAGRIVMWEKVLVESYKAPIFGNGTDVPVEFFEFFGWRHPHNDYLRVLHRYGAVGLLLFLGFIFSMMAALRSERVILSENSAAMPALILFSGFIIIMLTDNSLVYPNLCFAVAALCGVALRRRDRSM